jgi:hypothetical protein
VKFIFTFYWCVKNSYQNYVIVTAVLAPRVFCFVLLTRWIYKALGLHYLACRAYLERTATPCVNKTLPFNANTQNALAASNNFFYLT